MPIGRLAWRTPTGALLWEIRERRKWNFAGQGAALLTAVFAVHLLSGGPSAALQVLLRFLLLGLLSFAALNLLTCFTFITIDAQKVSMGYPTALFLKPVSSVRLAMVPMLTGAIVWITLFSIWAAVLHPILPPDFVSPPWLGAVGLSLLWWMQALAWSLPLFPGRSLVLVIVAAAHALLLVPFGQKPLLLLAMMVFALLTAIFGLAWMRHGYWEGLELAVRRLLPALATKTSRKFSSPFRAQFWLEWRRQGCVLPGMSAAIVVVVIPLVYLIQKTTIGPSAEDGVQQIVTALLLIIPLMMSGGMGPAMARFDPLRPSGDIPVYISVRPITNGGFVVTKMAVALLSSVVTWLIMAFIAVAILVFLHPALPYDLPQLLLAFGILFCFLVLLTWNNLVSGIALGLTGRPWLINLFGFGKAVAGCGVVALIFVAKYNDDFRQSLLRSLPLLLGLCLTVKVCVSAASLYMGRKRRLLSGGAATLIVAVWFFGGSFLAREAFLICQALNQSSLAPCGVAAGFFLMPIEGLALAPLAMAWNRHR